MTRRLAGRSAAQTGRARPKVLYVGTLPPHPGGSAIVGAHLVGGLARRGHAVRALAPFTAEARRRGDRFAQANPAVGVHRFLVPYFESAPNNPASLDYRRREGRLLRKKLHQMIDAEHPDVLVIGRETFAWHVPDVAASHALPCLLLAQGATTAGMRSGSLPPAMTESLMAQLRRVDLIVLVARHLRELYRGWGLERLRVVQNPVDRRRFAPRPKDRSLLAQLRIGPASVVVLHASNLKDIKRPFDIVESAHQALRQDPRLVYVIVGDGPLRAAIEEQCHRLGVANAFRFVDWVDHETMPNLLNLADIVVMPSQTEALALVYLETLACGRVLLASDIPAAREVVRDGRDGVLFGCGDVGDLTAKTLRLAASPALRAAIGARARERSRRFTLGRFLEAYAALVSDVVRRHRSGMKMGGERARHRQPIGRRLQHQHAPR